MRFQVDEPAVWSELGHAQLDNGLVAEAIASYLRSNDTSRSSDVIERSKEVCASAPLTLVPPLQLLFKFALNTSQQRGLLQVLCLL